METQLDRHAVKAVLRGIENELGRIRTANKDGPRTIDLDVVVWNGGIVDDDVFQRDFLKQAVLELMPSLQDELDNT